MQCAVFGDPRLQYSRVCFTPLGDTDRDEIDLVIETGSGALVGIEVKASATVNAGHFKGLRKLADASGDDFKLGVVLNYCGRPVPFGDVLWQCQ